MLELASCVQELIRAEFPHRPWSQLVARLDPQERLALGGGDDRRLAQRISSRFGARSRQGPDRALVDAALRYCLPAVPADQRDLRRTQLEDRWRAVHGDGGPAVAAAGSRRRGGGLGEQLRQQRELNAVLSAELARVVADKTLLEKDLKAAQARLTLIEAERAVSAGQPRTVGILAGGQDVGPPDLVRPYTRALPEPPEPAEPPQDPPAVDAEVTAETLPPTGAELIRAYRDANRPRTFLPLPRYRPGLEGLAPPTPLRVPGSRVVAWYAAPPGCLLPAPRQPLDALVQQPGGLSSPPWPGPADTTDLTDLTDTAATTDMVQRRRARFQAARIVTEIGSAWLDQWADLPVDRLPDYERGSAQLPLLAVVSVLACLIATVPAQLL
ncbi:hypothetical protein [Actinoplanes subglobosus]|uniref:Uncharacterized protein n=1 Tax=Actinoplanes subglobosus TaxID=1547892 RepID=A0ABV8IYL1_9ACTN